jgi:hypothetical protein
MDWLQRKGALVRRAGKQRHDGVADVLVDEAAMAGNHRLHLHQVGIQEIEVLLRAHGFRQGGKVAYVAKQDRHLALDLLPEFHLADVIDAQQVQELARHEAAVGGGRLVQAFAQ